VIYGVFTESITNWDDAYFMPVLIKRHTWLR